MCVVFVTLSLTRKSPCFYLGKRYIYGKKTDVSQKCFQANRCVIYVLYLQLLLSIYIYIYNTESVILGSQVLLDDLIKSFLNEQSNGKSINGLVSKLFINKTM